MNGVRAVKVKALVLAATTSWCGSVLGAGPAPSPSEVRPALIGTEVADLTLRTAAGAAFDLNAAFAEKPTVLILYRGGW